MKGPNTNNTLLELLELRIRINNGTFKYDGYPDAANDINSDIEYLISSQNNMTVQEYIEKKYRDHLREQFRNYENGMSPDDFIDSFDHFELASEHWYAKPIYDDLEDMFYEALGDKYDTVLSNIIEIFAINDLTKVDTGRLLDVAESVAEGR